MLSLHPSSLQFSRLPIPEEQSASIHSDSGSEIQGFSLIWSDSAMVSPLSEKGIQKLARQCLDRESVPHPNESGTRCKPSGVSAKVLWMLQKLVSY